MEMKFLSGQILFIEEQLRLAKLNAAYATMGISQKYYEDNARGFEKVLESLKFIEDNAVNFARFRGSNRNEKAPEKEA